MGLHHSPRIITNNLTLHLDAANPKSYAGAGTVWNDISGNNIAMTLVNSGAATLSFTTGAAGYANFEATADIGTFTHYSTADALITSDSTNLSIEVWQNVNSFSGNGRCSPYDARLTEDGAPLFAMTTPTGIYHGLNTSIGWYTETVDAPGTGIGNWVQVVATTDDTSKKIVSYVNGAEVSSLGYLGTPTAASGLLIGKAYNGGERHPDCKVSIVRWYNKTLTAAEIKQNFEANRGRYGI